MVTSLISLLFSCTRQDIKKGLTDRINFKLRTHVSYVLCNQSNTEKNTFCAVNYEMLSTVQFQCAHIDRNYRIYEREEPGQQLSTNCSTVT